MNKPSTLSQCVSQHAANSPHDVAYYCAGESLDWAAYNQSAFRLAALLVQQPLQRGDCVAVLLPDGFELHIALLALERAGLLAMGIGPRAGAKEVKHLLQKSGAKALLSLREHRGEPSTSLATDLSAHILLDNLLSETAVVNGEEQRLPAYSATLTDELVSRSFTDEELFFLNSTSGTTGMPKCVAHNNRRWFFYHQLVLETARFHEDDVFMSCISGTFGFGLWTTRFTPTILGRPCVIAPRFSADAAIQDIRRHRVTVLAAVSTQFIMMLSSMRMLAENFASLRLMYTGGEAVPHDKSLQFEDISGAKVLQFYGSNETGALSATTEQDSREHRLTSAGRVLPNMGVRLVDEQGRDVTDSGYGRAACRGEANSLGYYNDPEATKELYTDDGWMLTGDFVRIDEAGYLYVEGRASDFIIRGGKNISAVAVEEAVMTHPNVKVAAAIAARDPVFGERVCVVVERKQPDQELNLEALREYLKAQDYSVEYIPEVLHLVASMPISSGGKIAKGKLRERFGT